MEVIFVSDDNDEQACKEYFDSMKWDCAVKFTAGNANMQVIRQHIKNIHNVQGIPKLVVYNRVADTEDCWKICT